MAHDRRGTNKVDAGAGEEAMTKPDASKIDPSLATSQCVEKSIVSDGNCLSDARPTYGGGFMGIFILSLDEDDRV